MYYLKEFVLYSILGYIFEVIGAVIMHKDLNSGFMYGPYTIVYGISIPLIYIIYKQIEKTEKNKWKKLIKMFITGFILSFILEFIGAYLLKYIYHLEMWNYEKLPLHIGKYLSIEVTTLWTIGVIFLYKFIKPVTDKIVKHTPKFLTLGILLIMSLDFILTTAKAITS